MSYRPEGIIEDAEQPTGFLQTSQFSEHVFAIPNSVCVPNGNYVDPILFGFAHQAQYPGIEKQVASDEPHGLAYQNLLAEGVNPRLRIWLLRASTMRFGKETKPYSLDLNVGAAYALLSYLQQTLLDESGVPVVSTLLEDAAIAKQMIQRNASSSGNSAIAKSTTSKGPKTPLKRLATGRR